jgi:hypothetical protein
VAKLVAHLLTTAVLWVRIPDISQKYKMGDISRGVAKTLQPAKKLYDLKVLSSEKDPAETRLIRKVVIKERKIRPPPSL